MKGKEKGKEKGKGKEKHRRKRHKCNSGCFTLGSPSSLLCSARDKPPGLAEPRCRPREWLVTGCVGDDHKCHPRLGGSPKRAGVWPGHRETPCGQLGSAPGVPQGRMDVGSLGHVTGVARLLEVPWVCARELSKLRMLKRCEDSPLQEGDPRNSRKLPGGCQGSQDVSREPCAVPLASHACAPGTRP